MKIENPFHSGELEAQRLAGESAIAKRNSVVIADTIIPGALPFLKEQAMVVLGTMSEDGALWASALFGVPGFVSPVDARTVEFDCARMHIVKTDALWGNLKSAAPVAMLAIDLSTRRRLRVNGTLTSTGTDAFALRVKEAYPNCPKYIQRRTLHWEPRPSSVDGVTEAEGSALTSSVSEHIQTADTLFITSRNADRGMDVSHRGGSPGFILQKDAFTLRIPDYAGNSLFNTFGNLLRDPRAGVTVMDFAHGKMLQMSGQASIEWDHLDELGETGGTGRFLTLRVDRWRMVPMPTDVRWEFLDPSPFNPRHANHTATPLSQE